MKEEVISHYFRSVFVEIQSWCVCPF